MEQGGIDDETAITATGHHTFAAFFARDETDSAKRGQAGLHWSESRVKARD